MKTRINLFAEEFKPKRDPLPLGLAVGICLVLLLLVVIYGSWQSYRLGKLNQQLRVQNTELNQQQTQLEKLKQTLDNRAANPDLQLRVQRMQRELETKRLLSQRLTGQSYANSGFSSALVALSEVREEQVWLTEINIAGGRMSLRGQTLESQAVPRWVSGFSRFPELAAQSFAGLSIETDENNNLLFSLSGSALLSQQQEQQP